ncbi:MAG TPA: DUF1667 domain-containing protein [Clostridiales bacterium]|jgi:CxxC motif-containing protein|nr:DUF1667 domain-containing protein [Clostridiales bacterium]
MLKEMICVSCPIGCSLKVEIAQDGSVANVEGNQCNRGHTYAVDEITRPMRMLTTTVAVEGGKCPLVPVRSAGPIPKDLLLQSMKVVNSTKVKAPVKLGDVVIKNILKTGVDLIATADCEG